MERPKRKRLRLKDYDYSQNGYYFITICVKDEKIELSNIVGRDDLGTPGCVVELTENGEIVDKYIKLIPEKYNNVVLDNYVIMPDHVHLLLLLSLKERDANGVPGSSRPTGNVPKIIAALKRLINREIGRNIFQASFYDHVIRDEGDYVTKYNYIENNPANRIEKC